MHALLEKERQFYVGEMAGERELQARLDAANAQLAAERAAAAEALRTKDELLQAAHAAAERQTITTLNDAAAHRDARHEAALAAERRKAALDLEAERARARSDLEQEKARLAAEGAARAEAARLEARQHAELDTAALNERIDEARAVHRAQLDGLRQHYEGLLRDSKEAKRDATAILEAPSWAQGSIGVGVGAKAGRAAKNR